MNKKALPRHVLHLVRWYPYDEDPMLGLFIQNHIRALSQGLRSTVIFVWPVKGARELRREVREAGDVREVRILYPEKKSRFLNFFAFFKHTWREAAKLYREDPFELTHVHVLTRMGVIALALKLRFGIPYVISEHWSRYNDPDRYRGIFRKWITRLVVKRSNALTNVSQFLQNAMLSRGLHAPQMVIVPNVVDCDLFQPAETGEYFVHVSCFQPEAKNVLGLVEAWELASKSGYRRLLEMVGSGEARDECMISADSYGLRDQITFPGLLQGRKLAQKVAEAKALIVYSNYENLPVVILEALAAGVPVISTSVGGISEVIHENNGILITPRDPESLIAALKKIDTERNRYDPEQIRREACARFGISAVRDAFHEIYREVFEKK